MCSIPRRVDLADVMTLTKKGDGCVRLFRDYDSPKPTLVTAWRALSQIVQSTYDESGLVCEWVQARGRLLAGGNAREIKLWDATAEVCERVSFAG